MYISVTEYSQSTQGRLTNFDVDLTPTPTIVSYQHGWKKNFEEFDNIGLFWYAKLLYYYSTTSNRLQRPLM